MRTRHEHADSGFSAQLCIDVTSAISTYLSGATPLTDARLQNIANRACTESHALRLPIGVMIAHTEELSQRVPRFAGDAEHRKEAFQRIILACQQAYRD